MAKPIVKKKKGSDKLSISVCILSKNAENLIEDCIKEVKGFAREILVMDYGSTDNTVSIAQKYTQRVFDYVWDNDFSNARNAYLKYASSDWVLVIDPHERLTEESKNLLKTPGFLNKENIAYMAKVNTVYQEKDYENYECKLFRRRKDIRFKFKIFENVNKDIQNIASSEKLNIAPPKLEFNRYNYLKYFDENDMFQEIIDLTKEALEKGDNETTTHLFYKMHNGLSINALGERRDAHDILMEVIEEIRELPAETNFNIPSFIQLFSFFGFYYSKLEKYEEALKYIEEGLVIYFNSLNLIIRQVELLYALGEYKRALDNIALIRKLIRDDKYYLLEGIDFQFIHRLTNKMQEIAYKKFEESNTE